MAAMPIRPPVASLMPSLGAACSAVVLVIGAGVAPPALAQNEAPPDPRRAQLGLHQVMGLGTLGAMAATGIAGQIYNQQRAAGQPASAISGLATTHLALAAVAGAAYLTTATLALTAPAPDPAAEPAYEGVDSILIHRGLALLHVAGIGSTIALGFLGARSDPAFTDAHKVLGLTTFGLMAASAAVVAIDF